MNNLKGQSAELHMVVNIKRAVTGTVETYDMVGRGDLEQIKQLVEDASATETKEHKA